MGLDEFFVFLSDEDKLKFSQIAEYAIHLGYKPKKAKTQSINYVFTNNKTKAHMLKFSIEKGNPYLKMKFYATKSYSLLFHEGIRAVVEEFNYRYTGCYECGKCKDTLHGYEYTYPDGRTFFRCGSELICLPDFTQQDIPEILDLLQTQHDYYLSKLQIKQLEEKL
ncbi:hypothetical protein [Paenibacillus segetis]|nr:hypothetical protein [Paenibacillus segetis]